MDDKVALITAGSRGIGLACAQALAARGARVAVCGRDPEALERATHALRAHGGPALGVAVDLQDPDGVAELLARVRAELGTVDILVSNSGGPPLRPFVELELGEWRRWVDELLLSVVAVVNGVVPGMQARGAGAITFLTSTWVKQPRRDRAALSVSLRSAVAGLSKQLANELGPDGIRVNHVMPGPIETDRLRGLLSGGADGRTLEERRAEIAAGLPLRRLGRPEEVAAAVAFLSSDEASFVTGVTLSVDGGQVQSLL